MCYPLQTVEFGIRVLCLGGRQSLLLLERLLVVKVVDHHLDRRFEQKVRRAADTLVFGVRRGRRRFVVHGHWLRGGDGFLLGRHIHVVRFVHGKGRRRCVGGHSVGYADHSARCGRIRGQTGSGCGLGRRRRDGGRRRRGRRRRGRGVGRVGRPSVQLLRNGRHVWVSAYGCVCCVKWVPPPFAQRIGCYWPEKGAKRDILVFPLRL